MNIYKNRGGDTQCLSWIKIGRRSQVVKKNGAPAASPKFRWVLAGPDE